MSDNANNQLAGAELAALREHVNATVSPWVQRCAPQIPGGEVLDLACGSGRHARHLVSLGTPCWLSTATRPHWPRPAAPASSPARSIWRRRGRNGPLVPSALPASSSPTTCIGR